MRFTWILLLVAACGIAPSAALRPPVLAPAGSGPVVDVEGAGSGGDGGAIPPLPERVCDDGIDDDGDGAVDCEDPDCIPDTVLAKDVAEEVAAYARGADGRGIVLYSASG